MTESDVVKSLAALAQPVRLQVFRALVIAGPRGMTPSTMAEGLGIASSTLSFHLKELANAGLVLSRQESRFIWYRADFDAMTQLLAYMTANCCRSSAACDPACVPSICATPAPARRTITKRRAS